MVTLDQSLEAELAAMKAAGTLKELRHITGAMDTEVDMEEAGHALVLSSNNYLGLANHPEVIEAGCAALMSSWRPVCRWLPLVRCWSRLAGCC